MWQPCNYDFQIFYFLTLLACNAIRKNSVNHKNKEVAAATLRNTFLVG